MSKMIDLGVTDSAETEAPVRSRTKRFPTVWLDSEIVLPFEADDVGKDFKINGTIHITGIEENVDEKGRSKQFSFELRSMQIQDGRSKLKKALKKVQR